MKKVQGYAQNFLFALNIFIAFLLLLESRLAIPQWIQPFGRMHALILHFPIVLLLLSMVMEFFRFKPDYQTNDFYQRFTSSLLLTGVISAGITVIMGIFLSQEEGYAGAALSWHKWWGASVFFISSLIYSSRHSGWYKAPVAKSGALLTTLCLIFAGHFGGVLTHGDNFIWQPVIVSEPEIVPLDEALVFDHVIKPLFERKCVGCHNADKLKGELMLTDSAAISKGGKTGELFVAGQPEVSLLLRRTTLPIDEKKHMPPSGKPQLTPEEQELLYRWVASGGTFSAKVMALPETDSLRIAATRFLKTEGQVEETFSFPAVAQESLQKLNSNYRVVSPLTRNSPALTVNIYNRDSYTPRSLDELKDVRVQIISLDLGKMPVKNADMKYIVRFENLRRLNLNFTEVTGEGLETLSALRELRSLSLSGTRVSYADLRNFVLSSKKLETLAVWETDLSPAEIAKLQAEFRYISILGGVSDDRRPLIKLNPPRLKNKLPVFSDSISLELFHPVRGVEIRFTTDGTEPDSISSPLFQEKTVLHKSAQVKARAFKTGWLSSDVAILNVYNRSHEPDTAILLSRLNRVHTANGAQTFFDRELGSFNANSPAWANNWAGFIRNDLELLVRFDDPKLVSSVSLNTLIETENFIFPPAFIEVWGGDSERNLRLIGRLDPELPDTYRKPFIKLFDCAFPAQEISHLKLIVRPVMKLPAWHKSKGRAALVLIDEILIN